MAEVPSCPMRHGFLPHQGAVAAGMRYVRLRVLEAEAAGDWKNSLHIGKPHFGLILAELASSLFTPGFASVLVFLQEGEFSVPDSGFFLE
ncbi:hypothetical protein [Akkermansia sp.]|uniref:hypothetical protein n=1 Tax=Akkermansia sp. TaxID=1872421 RepID=UPI00267358FE|nr:hypothetical protein [Akkermansia sp.]MEE0764262.1 hypothetical protein [Akkermansia sp.]